MSYKRYSQPSLYKSEEVITLADYMIELKVTLDELAEAFNMKENDVFRYLTKYLRIEDLDRYEKVKKVFEENNIDFRDNNRLRENNRLSYITANKIYDWLKNYAIKEKGIIYREEMITELTKEFKIVKSSMRTYLTFLTLDAKISIVGIHGNLSALYINEDCEYYK